MSKWVPLSMRSGKREESGPFEGFPDHLLRPMLRWFHDKVGYGSVMNPPGAKVTRLNHLAVRLQIVVDPNDPEPALIDAFQRDHDRMLDGIDMGLLLVSNSWGHSEAQSLEAILALGGSIWTVNGASDGLERRVTEAEKSASVTAMTPTDEAADHLREAWQNTYGVHPDPSDAWDHSIKAVEAIYIPIVCPYIQKATLGNVAGDLKTQTTSWSFGLETSSTLTLDTGAPISAVLTVESMIRMIWPNPDRHEGGNKRMPTLDEAQAVLGLAITLVQWGRDGLLSKP